MRKRQYVLIDMFFKYIILFLKMPGPIKRFVMCDCYKCRIHVSCAKVRKVEKNKEIFMQFLSDSHI